MHLHAAAAGTLVRPGKVSLILLACLICFLVSPGGAAAAGNYTSLNVWTQSADTIIFSDVSVVSFDAFEQDAAAISEVTIFGINPGTYTLVFSQANGHIHTGSIIHESSGLLGSSGNWTLMLDGYSHSWTGLNLQVLGEMYIATYAQDIDTGQKGLIIVDGWIGNTIIGTVTGQYNCVFSPDSSLAAYPVTQFEMYGTDEFTVTIGYGDYESVSEEISNEDISVWSWVGNITGFVGNIGNILFISIGIFKFIFVDHFFSIVVLYESVAMAYSASKSRDIFTFVKRFVRMNKALFEIIIGFISVIISIFHRIIDALKPF